MMISESTTTTRWKIIPIGLLALAFVATGIGGWALAQDQAQSQAQSQNQSQNQSQAPGQAQDKLSKFLLIKLSREQSQVLCTSPSFTSCMGFSEQVCFEVSEKALEQCIVPLPDTIFLQDLSNDVLEACPQKVYADAGYSEEKAAACLQKATE